MLNTYSVLVIILNTSYIYKYMGLPIYLQVVKNLPANARNARDTDYIPGSGRSPREGNGNSFQYFLPGKSHREEPGALPSMGWQRVGHND